MNLRATILFFAIGLLPLAPALAAETTAITVGRARFLVELATTVQEHERGLMDRESLPNDRGMLFVKTEPVHVGFWMKNMRIPLDILYFDADGRLDKIMASVQPCDDPPALCPVYRSERPIKYVLEINAGLSANLGLKKGDTLRFAK